MAVLPQCLIFQIHFQVIVGINDIVVEYSSYCLVLYCIDRIVDGPGEIRVALDDSDADQLLVYAYLLGFMKRFEVQLPYD